MNTAAMYTTGVMGQSHAHESAKAQVLGAAPYLDDLAELRGTLYAAPILSTVAHGTLHGLDCTDALAMPGVHGVVLAADIPGDPILAAFGHDEPIFALDKVWHVGQVMGLVVANSVMAARRAARKVKADITPLPAVLDTATAIAQQSFVLPPVHVRRGDADAGLARAPHRLQGTLEVGGQEHFYLEGQIAYVIPQEQNQWLVHSSTQHRAKCKSGWPTHWALVRMPSRCNAAAWAGALAAKRRKPGIWPSGRPWRHASLAAPSSCAWTATTTSWSPANATPLATSGMWALMTKGRSPG